MQPSSFAFVIYVILQGAHNCSIRLLLDWFMLPRGIGKVKLFVSCAPG
jgi:hypothetical protein